MLGIPAGSSWVSTHAAGRIARLPDSERSAKVVELKESIKANGPKLTKTAQRVRGKGKKEQYPRANVAIAMVGKNPVTGKDNQPLHGAYNTGIRNPLGPIEVHPLHRQGVIRVLHIHSLLHWIAGLASRASPTPIVEREAGVLVPVNIILDQVGDDPDVSMPRRWKEDCRSYRLRLQISLQEEIIRREKLETFLNLLLQTERS